MKKRRGRAKGERWWAVIKPAGEIYMVCKTRTSARGFCKFIRKAWKGKVVCVRVVREEEEIERIPEVKEYLYIAGLDNNLWRINPKNGDIIWNKTEIYMDIGGLSTINGDVYLAHYTYGYGFP